MRTRQPGHDDAVSTSAQWGRRVLLIWLVVAALALVVNGITVTTLLSGRGERPAMRGVSAVYDDARGTQAVELARTQVEQLVNLDADSGDEMLAELSARTTVEFRAEFDRLLAGFVRQLRRDGLLVEGEVVAAGLAALDGDRASALVATTGRAVDREESEPRTRNFTARVSLTWVVGRWQVDGLELV